MLDGDVTDMVEAKSLSLHPQHIDIYSASWGPDDDGKTVDGPASLARQAFENGIRMVGGAGVWDLGGGGKTLPSHELWAIRSPSRPSLSANVNNSMIILK